MSAPDPSVKRASGFLTPTFGNSNTVGFHFALPYFLVLGPDKDLTLAPRFTSAAGTVFAGEYRQRFGNGDAGRPWQPQPQQRRRQPHQFTTDLPTNGAATSTRTGYGTSTIPTAPASSSSACRTRLICCASASATPLLNAMISRAYLEGFHPRGSTDVNAYVFQPLTAWPRRPDPADRPAGRQPQLGATPTSLAARWNLTPTCSISYASQGTQTRRVSTRHRMG